MQCRRKHKDVFVEGEWGEMTRESHGVGSTRFVSRLFCSVMVVWSVGVCMDASERERESPRL